MTYFPGTRVIMTHLLSPFWPWDHQGAEGLLWPGLPGGVLPVRVSQALTVLGNAS